MAKDEKQNSHKQPLKSVTAEEQKIVSQWVKDERNINTTFVAEVAALAESDLTVRKTLGKQYEAYLDNAAINDPDPVSDKIHKERKAAEKKVTTSQVLDIVDRELSALLPQLQNAGVGKSVGNKDPIVTLHELKKALTKNGKELYMAADSEGAFTYRSVIDSLPKPSVPRVAPKLPRAPD